MEAEICLLSNDIKLQFELEQLMRADAVLVTQVNSLDQALRRLRSSSTLLLLIDENPQGRSGLDLLKDVRSDAEFDRNCVVLYARQNSEIDRVLAFEFGADNYFLKPMPPRELALRLMALMRHAPKPQGIANELRNGPVYINQQTREVLINDEELELTSLEFRLLSFLMGHPGVVHDRQTLLQEVWRWCDKDESNTGVSRTVDTHVKRLRQKLGNCGNFIETVRGVGYRYNPTATNTGVSDSPQSRHAVVTQSA